MKPLPSWRTRRRRLWLDTGPFLRVEAHDVRLPDGREIADWPWIVTPDYVVIAARDIEDRWLCFRQTKYAVPGITWAPPGGYLAPGEDPRAAAQRELREETGYTAPEWRALGIYPVDSNRGAGRAHFYLARRARPAAAGGGAAGHDDLEDQELLRLTDTEVRRALHTGRFKALPWVALMALALQETAVERPRGKAARKAT